MVDEASSSPEEEQEELFPPGFRFLPTDRELIFYIRCKLLGKIISSPAVFLEHDVYQTEPWNLWKEFHSMFRYTDGKEMYFFTKRVAKHKTGSRPTRTAGRGTWRASGKDEEIRYGSQVIGHKRLLSFHYSFHGGIKEKTEWNMHEYLLPSSQQSGFQDFTLVRILESNRPESKRQAEKRKAAIADVVETDQLQAALEDGETSSRHVKKHKLMEDETLGTTYQTVFGVEESSSAVIITRNQCFVADPDMCDQPNPEENQHVASPSCISGSPPEPFWQNMMMQSLQAEDVSARTDFCSSLPYQEVGSGDYEDIVEKYFDLDNFKLNQSTEDSFQFC